MVVSMKISLTTNGKMILLGGLSLGRGGCMPLGPGGCLGLGVCTSRSGGVCLWVLGGIYHIPLETHPWTHTSSVDTPQTRHWTHTHTHTHTHTNTLDILWPR